MPMRSKRFARSPRSQATGKTPDFITKEFAKCLDDFEYFAFTYIQIMDKEEKRWIPFDLWEGQRRVAQRMQAENKLVILKTRQIGLSWLAGAYVVWHMIFDPIAEALVFSKTEREAIDFLTRVKGMYERLPVWMQAKYIKVDAKTEFQLSNESRVKSLPSTAGDSYAATLVIMDEFDHVQNPEPLLDRVEPTIGKTGKLFIISTSNKDRPASHFKNLFHESLANHTDYSAIFLAWYEHPERDKVWYEALKEIEYKKHRNLDNLYAQYPETPIEALQGRTSDKHIPAFFINRAYDDLKPVAWIGNEEYEDIPSGVPFINDLIVYELPIAGMEYVIGADTAEGGTKSDDSAVTVCEKWTMVEVASLSGRIATTPLAHALYKISKFYNNATIMCERNNHGHAVISTLLSLEDANIGLGLDYKWGWNTNATSKVRMYTWVFDLFAENSITIRTLKTLLQLGGLLRSTLSAPPNEQDDCAMSVALAVAGAIMIDETRGESGLLPNEDA